MVRENESDSRYSVDPFAHVARREGIVVAAAIGVVLVLVLAGIPSTGQRDGETIVASSEATDDLRDRVLAVMGSDTFEQLIHFDLTTRQELQTYIQGVVTTGGIGAETAELRNPYSSWVMNYNSKLQIPIIVRFPGDPYWYNQFVDLNSGTMISQMDEYVDVYWVQQIAGSEGIGIADWVYGDGRNIHDVARANYLEEALWASDLSNHEKTYGLTFTVLQCAQTIVPMLATGGLAGASGLATLSAGGLPTVAASLTLTSNLIKLYDLVGSVVSTYSVLPSDAQCAASLLTIPTPDGVPGLTDVAAYTGIAGKVAGMYYGKMVIQQLTEAFGEDWVRDAMDFAKQNPGQAPGFLTEAYKEAKNRVGANFVAGVCSEILGYFSVDNAEQAKTCIQDSVDLACVSSLDYDIANTIYSFKGGWASVQQAKSYFETVLYKQLLLFGLYDRVARQAESDLWGQVFGVTYPKVIMMGVDWLASLLTGNSVQQAIDNFRSLRDSIKESLGQWILSRGPVFGQFEWEQKWRFVFAGAVPSQPTNVQVFWNQALNPSNPRGIYVSWDEPSETGSAMVSCYRVYRGTSPGGESHLSEISSAQPRAFVDTDVGFGLTYYYRVTAVNLYGEGTSSSEVSYYAPDLPHSCSLVRTTTCIDAMANLPYDPILEREVFRSTDPRFLSWVHMAYVSKPMTVRWDFFTPSGGLFQNSLYFAIPDPASQGYDYWEYYKCWYGWMLNGYLSSTIEGRWTVVIYVDDGTGYVELAREFFTIRYEFSEAVTAREILPYPNEPAGITSHVLNTEPRIYAWMQLDNVGEGLNVRFDWYQPGGGLYLSVPVALQDPGQGSYFGWSRAWSWIDIAGAPAGSMPGAWRVEVRTQDPFGTWDLNTQLFFQLWDNTAPIISSAPTDDGDYTRSHMANWTWAPAVDDSEVSHYIVQIGTSPGGSDYIEMNVGNVLKTTAYALMDGSTYYLRVRAVNAYGLTGPWSESSDGITVDMTPPTSFRTLSTDGHFGLNGFIVGDAIVELGASDMTSGIASISYQLDGLPVTEYTGPIVISEDGIHQLSYWSEDRAGNRGEINMDTIMIDSLPPTCEFSIDGGAPFTSSSWVTLDVNADDPVSGVWQMCLSNDGVSWSDWAEFQNAQSYYVGPEEGLRTIYLKVRDYAGNELLTVDDIIVGPAPLPDLTITYMSYSDGLFEVQISNIGPVDAFGTVYFDLYAVSDPFFPFIPGGPGIVSFHVFGLAAGGVVAQVGFLDLPGPCYLIGVVDGMNAIVESDESNNMWGPIYYPGQWFFDLVFDLTLDKTSYSPGEPVGITMKVTNLGPGVATIEFTSSLHMYFVIADSDGTPVYDLRNHVAVTWWISELVLNPGESESSYWSWDQTDDAGNSISVPGSLRVVGLMNGLLYQLGDEEAIEIGPFTLALSSGWNFVSSPLEGASYMASTLPGLQEGDTIVGWDESTQSYSKPFIVGYPTDDFEISTSDGYWIFADGPRAIELSGSLPTDQQLRPVDVPDAGWVMFSAASTDAGLHASDVAGMYQGGTVSAVVCWDPLIQQYTDVYLPGFPTPDFGLVAGEAYWIFVVGDGTVTYTP